MRKSGLAEINNQAQKQHKQAEQYLAKGKLAESIEACRAALKLKPNFALAYKTMGNALLMRGNLAAASQAYRKAIELKPNDAELLGNIGMILAKTKHYAESIEYFGQSIAIQPNLAPIHWLMGESLIQQKQYDVGLSSQIKALELQPDLVNASGYNNLGSGLAWNDRLSEAIDCYQTAIQLQPKYVQAHLNLANALYQFGRVEASISMLRTTIEIQPEFIEAYSTLAMIYFRDRKIDESIEIFQQITQLQPDHPDAYLNLGAALAQQNRLDEAIEVFQQAIKIEPNFSDAHFSLGVTLLKQDKQSQSIDSLQQAIQFKPNYPEAYFYLGIALAQQNRLDEAIIRYQQAIQFRPDFANCYWYLCNALGGQIDPNFPLLRQTVDRYIQFCQDRQPIQTKFAAIVANLKSGLAETAAGGLVELETEIYAQIDRLTKQENTQEIDALHSLLFNLPYLRDDVAANAKTSKIIGGIYAERVIQQSEIRIKSDRITSQLKIGFLSQHFGRHPIGWCSIDVLRELAKITPHVYLYATGKSKASDLTAQFAQIATKFWQGSLLVDRISQQICEDEIDILIDLDSAMTPLHAQIFASKPSPVCVSWLGCDAPFMSAQNYYLCDRHTHPLEVEQYYLEQLIRMPDSHMAVSGFPCDSTGLESLRQSLEITSDRLVYLCVAPGHKFSSALATAQVNILSQVPNSILIHKGKCDRDLVRDVYQKACETFSVDFDRIKFLPLTKTEEEHRLTYQLADVVLDSYPYNGGSHNVEALWFDCPIVTMVGSQYSCRLGYSFLQTLGISSGIAQNWDEYVTWGARLGLDRDLRDRIKAELVKSKQPQSLSPLWNPQKFAQDLYSLLAEQLKESLKA